MATSQSWYNLSSGSADYFFTGDNTTFNDTAGTANNVTISGTVAPGSLTVSNTNVNFTFSGTGSIAGGTSLVMNGPGTLTINNSNSYAGGTTLFNGLLNVANSAALGSGPLTITGGSLDNTSGTAMVLAGNIAQNWNGSFTFVGSSPLNTGTGAVTVSGSPTVTVNASTLTVGGAISGTGGLTMGGGGALTLSGSNSTYSGGATLTSGVLNINNSSALGTGTFTIAGGTIDNTSGAAITLSTSNAQSWNNNFTFNGTNNLNLGTGAVTLGTSPQVTVNGGTLTVGGPISGLSLGITKSGTGQLTLGGSNTYTGATVVNAGVLDFTGGNVLPATTFSGSGIVRIGAAIAANNTNPVFGSGFTGLLDVEASFSIATAPALNWYSNLGALNVASGAAFSINGVTAASPATTRQFDYLSGSGTIQDSAVASDAPTILNVGANNGSGTFAGSIVSSSPVNGAISLLKIGTGAETLTGTTTTPAAPRSNPARCNWAMAATRARFRRAARSRTTARSRSIAVITSRKADFSGSVITGFGGLTQMGPGTLTLNAANS